MKLTNNELSKGMEKGQLQQQQTAEFLREQTTTYSESRTKNESLPALSSNNLGGNLWSFRTITLRKLLSQQLLVMMK